MTTKLPPSLRSDINSLAAKEMRKAIYDRGAELRKQYASRPAAGETIEDLSREIKQKTRLTAGLCI